MGKHVGSFIRQLREKRGLSQGDVAKLLNLKTAQSISNIERGVSPLPRTKIKRLADILGVKKSEIVTIVLREVQERVSKAVGVSDLSSEEFNLVNLVAERLRTAKGSKRALIKNQIKKVLTA